MDFFEAQARAKKRTSRLVVLFVLAVLGTIGAGYFAALFGLNQLDESRSLALWQPQLFLGVAGGTLAVVGLASLFKWSQFSAGGSAVAQSVGARRVDPHTTDTHERRLLNVVEEMAIASGTPVPAVFIMDDEPAINAFAAGLTTNDAVVAVTRGTLEKLTRDELQGVVAHEFSHILNGDMRLNLRLAAIVFGILVLGIVGRGILYSLRYSRVGGSRNKKDGNGALLVIMAAGFILLLIGYVGYFFGRLIQAAVSRQREYLADASAVQFTRNPGGISGALKKIGGYALGSSLQSTKSAAIGHFFFAQCFKSNFGGLWATHPPLPERIRAIEPQFDGQFFVPPEVVDVRRESFADRGLSSKRPTPRPAAAFAPEASTAAVAQTGTLTAAQVTSAQAILAATPERLRDAAHSAREAPLLLCGLLLHEPTDAVRAKQRAIVAQHLGGDALRLLDELDPALRALRPEHKLPLLQLALPEIRQLAPTALAPVIETLDELVHADAQVSPFEFTLQKLLLRSLHVGRTPQAAVVQIYSFNSVVGEISAVLSTLARAAVADPAFAPEAFAAGAAQLKLVEAQLRFHPTADLAALDAALDKLAVASLPIRQRTLIAAAHVINADGRVLATELELLRAIAATLDIPLPASTQT